MEHSVWSSTVHPPKTRTQIAPSLFVWCIRPTHFLLNFIAHEYAAREAVIMTVYVIHCNLQQNTALYCAISDFVVLLLFADASCLIQWRSRKIFFHGRDIGREASSELHIVLVENRYTLVFGAPVRGEAV